MKKYPSVSVRLSAVLSVMADLKSMAGNVVNKGIYALSVSTLSSAKNIGIYAMLTSRLSITL